MLYFVKLVFPEISELDRKEVSTHKPELSSYLAHSQPSTEFQMKAFPKPPCNAEERQFEAVTTGKSQLVSHTFSHALQNPLPSAVKLGKSLLLNVFPSLYEEWRRQLGMEEHALYMTTSKCGIKLPVPKTTALFLLLIIF